MSKSLFLALIFAIVISALNYNLMCGADTVSVSQHPFSYHHLIIDDKDGSAHVGLIVALAKHDRVSEAEKCLREAKERFPDNADLKAAAGFISYTKAINSTDASKRDLYFSAAENLCRTAIKENPNSLTAHQTIGLTKVALSEPEQAVGSFRKCVQLAETPENLTNLAVVLRKSDRRNKEGAKLINQALLLDKNYFPAHVEEAAILLNENKSKGALIVLQRVPAAKRDAQWLLVAGDIYCKKGDYNSAFASWNNSVRLDSYLSDTYQHMADYYASHGKDDLAVRELHRGLEVNPFNKTLREQLLKIAHKSHLKLKPNLELDPAMSFERSTGSTLAT